jgi:hypothetical protein
VRVAAADDYRIALPRQVQIVGVAAFAAQQSRIFVAWDRLADTVFGQGKPVEIDIAVHSVTSIERSRWCFSARALAALPAQSRIERKSAVPRETA